MPDVTDISLCLVLAIVGGLLVDCCICPHGMRRDVTGNAVAGGVFRTGPAILLLTLATTTGFGVVLGVSGNSVLALIFVLALHLLLMAVSNAKWRMLGEPLVFSDLALVGAVFRHPQFYFSALPMWQKLVGVIALASLPVALAWFFDPSPTMHLAGALIGLLGVAVLAMCLRSQGFRALAAKPDHTADVARLGLLPTLLLYWMQWRRSEAKAETGAAPMPSVPVLQMDVEIIIAVQCESFADPVDLFGDEGEALECLQSARAKAVQWGNLQVSGFGAYTMRTEYGVLFGREEEELGFRRFDPFLTALDDVAWALPHRLGGDHWQSLFVHPHDMRFYNRDRILPAAGFSDLVSEEAFAELPFEESRYVPDAIVADKLLDLAKGATSPAFLYAVTMENHGPWSGQGAGETLQDNYTRLVRAGDAMLGQLQEGIAKLGKPALLVFFGDHRPSIPGASEPGGDRHTPYVIMRVDAQGRTQTGDNTRRDITPASLHHAILGLGGREPKS